MPRLVKYKVNCKVCQLSRGNPKLRARLQAAYYSQDTTDERVSQIAIELGINHGPMYNHCKRHIRPFTAATPLIVEGRIARMKATVAKGAELSFDHESVVPQEDFEMAVTGVIAEGLAQMKNGDKTVTISQLLTAAKIKADYSAKKRGQDVEMLKTMYRFTSGNKHSEKAQQGS